MIVLKQVNVTSLEVNTLLIKVREDYRTFVTTKEYATSNRKKQDKKVRKQCTKRSKSHHSNIVALMDFFTTTNSETKDIKRDLKKTIKADISLK